MKKVILGALVALSSLAFTNNSTEFKVDAGKSKLVWVGRKVVGEHTGNINIKEGKLITEGRSITGGTFTIDMQSITDNDLADKGYNEKLVGHLKSKDFFDSESSPNSLFVITRITPAKEKDQFNVKGNLTIKGITQPVEFPAIVQITGNQIKATAKIKVDRTKYGIRYGSGSFFDNLGDKAIDNEFELNVTLLALKELI